MAVQVDLEAPIVPDEGLGGLLLRRPLTDYWHLLPLPHGSKRAENFLASEIEARYRVASGAIDICVDVRNGRVFKLLARPGYRGVLFGRITVGMSVAEAMRLDARLHYDEREECILCRGVRGLSLDVPEIDPPPHLVPGMSVASINVYVHEVDTPDFARGAW